MQTNVYNYFSLQTLCFVLSAGIGRTGTFIALDHLIDQGRKENIVDVFALINKLRSYRVNMVQTRVGSVILLVSILMLQLINALNEYISLKL